MKVKKVCILGGTGFVGQRLVLSLSQHGYQIRVLSRHPERHRNLESREVELLEADVHNEAQLRDQLAGTDAVINLVGILNERGSDGTGFRRAHVDLPRTVVAACKAAGVGRLLHMSALKAGHPLAVSHYLQTKGEGENLVHAAAGADLAVTSFRPSVIFGQNDNFLNRFAFLLRISPVIPLACSESRLAPIYVGDVVAAFAAALNDPTSHGNRYDLCGPKVYNIRQLVDYTGKLLQLQRLIIPLNPALSQMQAQILGRLPGKPLSMDNYLSLQLDSVCAPDYTLPFAISPTRMEEIAPYYIGDRGQRTRYCQLRIQAGREI